MERKIGESNKTRGGRGREVHELHGHTGGESRHREHYRCCVTSGVLRQAGGAAAATCALDSHLPI